MKLLCLTGGGFRGYYTSSVIEQLEKQFGETMHSRVNCIAGTSIGGILALGIASGKTSKTLSKEFVEHRHSIFTPKNRLHSHLYSTRYTSKGLKKAIYAILGDTANMTLAELAKEQNIHIMLTTVEMDTGKTVLLNSIEEETRNWSVMDAALATSAAPTYFPCKTHQSIRYIDGGVSCNMPDIFAAQHYSRLKDISIDTLEILSIGTGKVNVSNYQHIDNEAGSIRWALNLPYFLDVQAPLIEQQCAAMFHQHRYTRIDTVLDKKILLDDISDDALKQLKLKAVLSTSNEAIVAQTSLIQFMNTSKIS